MEGRQEWVEARALRIGDMLVGHDGARTVVEGVADSGLIESVYNFEVEGDHTYFVGGEHWGWDVWAHNAAGYRSTGDPDRPKPTFNTTVVHNTRKAALEAAAHSHKGKPRPTPPKSDATKRKSYDEQQGYRNPESHPDSAHPEMHFHDADKSRQIKRNGINRHHTFPQ